MVRSDPPEGLLIAGTATFVAWCAVSFVVLVDTTLAWLVMSHFAFWTNLMLAAVYAVAVVFIFRGAVGPCTAAVATTALAVQIQDAMPTWIHHFVPTINAIALLLFALALTGTWLSFFPAHVTNPAPIPIFTIVVNDKPVTLEAYSLLATSATALITLELNEIVFRLKRRLEPPTMRVVVVNVKMVDVNVPVDFSFLGRALPWKVASS